VVDFGNDILSKNGANGKEIGFVPKNTINNIIDKNNSWRPIIKIKLDMEKSGTTSVITTMIIILFIISVVHSIGKWVVPEKENLHYMISPSVIL
jgi:hypothetical protein